MNRPRSSTRNPAVEDFINRIKEANNILAIVGEHVVLRKQGANHTGLCPFHQERSPSFSVSEAKGVYHCYGCGRGGDTIKFVQEMGGIGFREAIEDLAERAGLPLPKEWTSTGSGPGGNEQADQRRAAEKLKSETASRLNRFVAGFFHQELVKSPKTMEYFRGRGLKAETIEEFYLGYAPDAWSELGRFLTSKKAPIELAIELGLLRTSEKARAEPESSGTFDMFRNRAIFPILDMRGRVAGFGGRVLGDDSPKYLNSSESQLFHKSQMAYGLFQAQKHIRANDVAVVVEGYFDVLLMHQAGFKNTVATCGTAVTADHLNQLSRFGSKIIILFDGDKAGIQATERTMELGLDMGMALYGAFLPAGKDPDEYVQETGPEAMKFLLDRAEPLLDLRIKQLLRGEQPGQEALGAEQKTLALKKISAWLGRYKDPMGREVRIEELSRKYNVPRNLLGLGMGGVSPLLQGRSKVVRPALPVANQTVARPVKMTSNEKVILQGMILGGAHAKIIYETLEKLPTSVEKVDLFEYPPLREFAGQWLEDTTLASRLREIPDSFFGADSDAQMGSIISETLMLMQGSDPSKTGQLPPAESVSVACNRRVFKIWARISQSIKVRLADAEAQKNDNLQSQLMQEYLDVQRKMKELSHFYDEGE